MRADVVADAGVGAALLLALFALTDRQRYVVVQRQIRGRTLDDIAVELGVTRQAVSHCEQDGLGNLRHVLSPLREVLAA